MSSSFRTKGSTKSPAESCHVAAACLHSHPRIFRQLPSFIIQFSALNLPFLRLQVQLPVRHCLPHSWSCPPQNICIYLKEFTPLSTRMRTQMPFTSHLYFRYLIYRKHVISICRLTVLASDALNQERTFQTKHNSQCPVLTCVQQQTIHIHNLQGVA